MAARLWEFESPRSHDPLTSPLEIGRPVGSLNSFRAVLTGATALAVVACIALGQYRAAIVLGVGVAVHTALFVWQRRLRTQDAEAISEAFESDLRGQAGSA